MKKISKILSVILVMSFMLSTTCFATEPDWDDDQHNIASNLQQIQVNYNIAEEFKNYDLGTLVLKNKDTLKTTSHTLTRMFAENHGTIFLSPGNYEYVGFSFSNKNGVAINYKTDFSPFEFSVDENGLVGDVPTLSVYLHITLPQKQVSKTLINDGDFDGYLGASYYTISDAYNGNDTEHFVTTVTHSFTRNGEIENKLYAGRTRITNVFAYDKNKEPLNVYVSPYYFYTRRTNTPNKLLDEPQYIYAFHNLEELTPEQISKIETEGYILFNAESMDEFATFPENELIIAPNGGKTPDAYEVYANDIPSPEAGWNMYTKGPSGKEVKIRYGFFGDENITEIETEHSFNFKWLLLLLIIPIAAGFFYLKNKNDKKEKEENNKNNKNNNKKNNNKQHKNKQSSEK